LIFLLTNCQGGISDLQALMPHNIGVPITQRLLTLTGLLVLAAVACAQRRVDPRNTYHRIIAVVPLVGAGTAADPRRPLYAPTANSASPDGIIAFTQVPTDDGKFAIVEFVAKDRKAFQAILSDAAVKC
jgi:hypothetical protein